MQRTRDCALACVAFRIEEQRRHPGFENFAVQWLACRCPLSTLRCTPRDGQRMTRGQDGSLLLSCVGLSPTITCQFVLAHSPDFLLIHRLVEKGIYQMNWAGGNEDEVKCDD